MFGRRRHAAKVAEVVAATPLPQLSETQILSIIHSGIADLLGPRGRWTVSPRTSADSDVIFAEHLAGSVADALTRDLMHARARLVAGESLDDLVVRATSAERTPAPMAIPVVVVAPAEIAEHDIRPSEITWEPAPITQWADLRRPVTGEIAVIGRRDEQQHAERPAA